MKLRFRSIDHTIEVPDGLLSDPTVEMSDDGRAEPEAPPEPESEPEAAESEAEADPADPPEAEADPAEPEPEAPHRLRALNPAIDGYARSKAEARSEPDDQAGADVVVLRPAAPSDDEATELEKTESGQPESDEAGQPESDEAGESEPHQAGESEPDRSEPAIDPRLRARRIAIQRARGRRRLNRLIAVVAGVALALVGWVATRTPLLDVDRVAVAGALRTPAAEVRAAAAVPADQALIDVDLEAIEARVDALPWVAGVEAGRHWPDTVVIRVEERIPVAVAPAADGGWAVLSADGRVMEVVAAAPAGLVPLADIDPVAAAPAPLPAITRDALEVARVIPASLLPRVAAVAPTAEEGELELRLRPSGVVRLGPATEVVDKIIAAHTVLSQTSEWCVGVLNVVVPEAPVLTPSPECG
jgi:cell division protein FtsQ